MIIDSNLLPNVHLDNNRSYYFMAFQLKSHKIAKVWPFMLYFILKIWVGENFSFPHTMFEFGVFYLVTTLGPFIKDVINQGGKGGLPIDNLT